MQPTAPFRLRRVIGAVLVVLVVAFLAAFGWVAYRTGSYHRHENAVVTKYRNAYRACLAQGTEASACSAQAAVDCRGDDFWRTGKPFNFGLGDDLDDATARCRIGTSR